MGQKIQAIKNPFSLNAKEVLTTKECPSCGHYLGLAEGGISKQPDGYVRLELECPKCGFRNESILL